jgi:putative transposase
MNAAKEAWPTLGKQLACQALALARATFYRFLRPKPVALSKPHVSPRALSEAEEYTVLETLHSERFMDQAPREVYATLLDEGTFLCSVSTMYRILHAHQEVRERRDQARHPNYKKPELLATGPNQVWSWDITKLLGPAKWTYYYLYVLMDIFSRYVVGWMVAHRESAALAEKLIEETCRKEGILPGQLTVHADNGPSMTSKTVAMLLGNLGVTKTHSRPYVSNDNPFSESQFKTLKYRPDFPERFGSMQDVRTFGYPFFHWYNWKHHHSGIGLLTPGMVHRGKAARVIELRQQTLTAAYQLHPERFVRKAPSPAPLSEAAWINPPKNGVLPEKTDAQDRIGPTFSEPDEPNIIRKSDPIIVCGKIVCGKKEVAIATLN